jgi:hypothetical protein
MGPSHHRRVDDCPGGKFYYRYEESYPVETGRCFLNPFDLLELDAVAGDSILLSTGGRRGRSSSPAEPHEARRETGLRGSARWVNTPPRSGGEILVEEGGASIPLPETLLALLEHIWEGSRRQVTRSDRSIVKVKFL